MLKEHDMRMSSIKSFSSIPLGWKGNNITFSVQLQVVIWHM